MMKLKKLISAAQHHKLVAVVNMRNQIGGCTDYEMNKWTFFFFAPFIISVRIHLTAVTHLLLISSRTVEEGENDRWNIVGVHYFLCGLPILVLFLWAPLVSAK